MNVLSVARFDANSDRANLNCNRNPTNVNSSLGIAYAAKALYYYKLSKHTMKTYKKIYPKIYSIDNLIRAWRKARKCKTKKE